MLILDPFIPSIIMVFHQCSPLNDSASKHAIVYAIRYAIDYDIGYAI